MTKRDYIAVAAVLHAERQAVRGEERGTLSTPAPSAAQARRTIDRIEDGLLELFKADNPLFDHQRFLLASGGDPR